MENQSEKSFHGQKHNNVINVWLYKEAKMTCIVYNIKTFNKTRHIKRP